MHRKQNLTPNINKKPKNPNQPNEVINLVTLKLLNTKTIIFMVLKLTLIFI